MFECQICGLLSLGGTACPACGSQLRTDLSTAIDSEEHLPNEVPGLDDAAAAWYDLEGIEPPEEAAESSQDSDPPTEEGSLPFGFQGQSNVYASRLPFGIGSFAEGIPFDAGSATPPAATTPESPRVEPVTEPTPAPSNTPSEPAPPAVDAVRATPPVRDVLDDIPEPIPSSAPSSGSHDLAHLPDVPVSVVSVQQEAPRPAPAPPAPAQAPSKPVRIQSARLVTPSPAVEGTTPLPDDMAPVQDEPPVPDYWRIDAQIPDYEEIYEKTEAVVEMEYASIVDDVVVFDHETDSPAAVFHSPLEATPVSNASPSIVLALHPVQALNIDVGGSAELQSLLGEGFNQMQQGSWSDAARVFQRLAGSLPTSPEVFNNYGISLLQRAIGMRDGADLQQQSMASAQFESAILALREAAKGAPANGDILVNLASALIESGRSEKALGIMNVHNARSPGSAKGLNTAAVAMFNLGQLTQSAEVLQSAGEDPVVASNLQKLSPGARAQ